MKGNKMRYGALPIAVFLVLLIGGCSVFISTPQVTRIQIQGVDDKLWEYIVTLDDPTENSLGVQISDRYAVQFDFEWLWNSDAANDIYIDLNEEYEDQSMAPWMLCKYRF